MNSNKKKTNYKIIKKRQTFSFFLPGAWFPSSLICCKLVHCPSFLFACSYLAVEERLKINPTDAKNFHNQLLSLATVCRNFPGTKTGIQNRKIIKTNNVERKSYRRKNTEEICSERHEQAKAFWRCKLNSNWKTIPTCLSRAIYDDDDDDVGDEEEMRFSFTIIISFGTIIAKKIENKCRLFSENKMCKGKEE